MGVMKTLTINGVTYDVVPVVPTKSVTLLASAWVTDGERHSQTVAVPGVTAHTKVDLQPTSEQLAEFHYKVLAFVAENDGGIVTVYSVGDKPSGDHTIQITLTEVEGTGKIRGNTVGTTMPRTDFNQTDSQQADYLVGREKIVQTVNGKAPDENGNVVVEGGSGGEVDLSDYAKKSELPTKVSQLTNDSGYITASGAPVQSVNGKAGAVKLSAGDVGADKSGAATSAVSGHNTSGEAHNDIRLLITGLSTRLDALANSDDNTLDQMAEVVAYIKANRNLIDQITTGKVSVSDIVNNLTTNVSNKPLSAAQGVALKKLIDAITVPTKVSQLANDKGYLTEHQDISGKLDASALPTAINTALAQAKASGEFDGKDGTAGVSVSSVKQTTTSSADGGSNVVTVTLSNGTTYTFTVKNGSKGSTGAAGSNGADGKTPVKGTDYFTASDKAELVTQVIAALPDASEVNY